MQASPKAGSLTRRRRCWPADVGAGLLERWRLLLRDLQGRRPFSYIDTASSSYGITEVMSSFNNYLFVETGKLKPGVIQRGIFPFYNSCVGISGKITKFEQVAQNIKIEALYEAIKLMPL